MVRVRAAVQEIATGIAAVHQHVERATTPVAATPKQPTPQQSLTLLEPLTQHLDTIHAGIGTVIEAVGKAQ